MRVISYQGELVTYDLREPHLQRLVVPLWVLEHGLSISTFRGDSDEGREIHNLVALG